MDSGRRGKALLNLMHFSEHRWNWWLTLLLTLGIWRIPLIKAVMKAVKPRSVASTPHCAFFWEDCSGQTYIYTHKSEFIGELSVLSEIIVLTFFLHTSSVIWAMKAEIKLLMPTDWEIGTGEHHMVFAQNWAEKACFLYQLQNVIYLQAASANS